MPFQFRPLDIPGVVLIMPRVFTDARGSFLETYRRAEFETGGIAGEFVQDNLARTTGKGTVRGLHFQKPPHAQAKLVQCLRGRVYDVAVDLRPGSATLGKFVSMELSNDPPVLLYVPRGFAHGYQTLTDDVEVLYKVDAEYAPAAESGVLWNDPKLAIPWPIAEAVVNERDRGWPGLL
jgi:dTDP-4-dehydrorhamnose 3,5-epimerase